MKHIILCNVEWKWDRDWYLANAIRTGRSNINTCKTIDKTNNHTSDKEIENGDWKLFQEIEKGDSNIVRLKLISKD